MNQALERIIEVIPPGWQYPDICQAEIIFGDKSFRAAEFKKTAWAQHADIIVQDQAAGMISVYYLEERPELDEGPFLREERRLINTIADQLGNFLLHQRLQDVFEKQSKKGSEPRSGWRVVLNLLQKTDPSLLITVARKMVHHLSGRGIKEAEGLLELFSSAYREDRELLESNFPYQFQTDDSGIGSLDEVFKLAEKNMDEDELLANVQQWIREDQTGFLINALVQPGRSLSEITGALDRFRHLSTQGLELSTAREHSVRVSLIRRLLSGQDKFIQTAKNYINIENFNSLTSKIIFQPGSLWKTGRKGRWSFFWRWRSLKKPFEIRNY